MTPRINQRLMRAAGGRSFGRFVDLLERLGDRNTHLLRVLTYHRVDELAARPDLYPGLISATPDEFARQMEYVASTCHAVDVADVLRAVRGDGKLPPRAVLITFDDAYRDFAEHAWPVLRRYGVPATGFVPTAYPSGEERSFWWDRLHRAISRRPAGRPLATPLGDLPLECERDRALAVRRLMRYAKTLPHHELEKMMDEACSRRDDSSSSRSVLSWEELRRLTAEGVTLAPHTRAHPLLSRVTLDEAESQVIQSRDDLAREIGAAPPVFAYPGGAFTGEVVSMLRSRGFELAFTTCRGVNDLRRADPLRLRRINVGSRTPTSLFRAQLLPALRHCNFCWPVLEAH